MDDSLEVTPFRAVPPATALEVLLFESRQLQARSEQLIKESRELRTMVLLQEHTYRAYHLMEQHPVLIIALLRASKRR